VPMLEWPQIQMIGDEGQTLEDAGLQVFFTSNEPNRGKCPSYRWASGFLPLISQAWVIQKHPNRQITGIGLFTGEKNHVMALDFDRNWDGIKDDVWSILTANGITDAHRLYEYRSDNPGKVHILFRIDKEAIASTAQAAVVFESKDICRNSGGIKETVVEIKGNKKVITTTPHFKSPTSFMISDKNIFEVHPITPTQWVGICLALKRKFDTWTPYKAKMDMALIAQIKRERDTRPKVSTQYAFSYADMVDEINRQNIDSVLSAHGYTYCGGEFMKHPWSDSPNGDTHLFLGENTAYLFGASDQIAGHAMASSRKVNPYMVVLIMDYNGDRSAMYENYCQKHNKPLK